jgi:osmotically-inducible protein OsmY
MNSIYSMHLVEYSGESYVFHTYLKDDAIKVQSKDGIVTLTGDVSEDYHKSLAQDTVAGLPEVKSVDNRLNVKDISPSPYSDAWIAGKVKVTLLFHRSVSASNTEVDVTNGIVTLRGNAANKAQKELTAEYTKDTIEFLANEAQGGRTGTRRQDHEKQSAETIGNARPIHLAGLHPARSDRQRQAPAFDR